MKEFLKEYGQLLIIPNALCFILVLCCENSTLDWIFISIQWLILLPLQLYGGYLKTK